MQHNINNINNNNSNSNLDTLWDDLSKHIFSSKNLVLFMKNIEHSADIMPTKKVRFAKQETNNNNKAPIKREKLHDNFDPSIIHKDSLFWCFYVLLNGIDKYDLLGNQYFLEEKKIKFQYIEILRKNKDLLKIYKIKPLSEIEDELANKDAIGIKTFVALCIVSNLNVMIINKRKYYEFRMNDDKKTTIIHQYDQPLKFVMEMKTSEETINYYRDSFFKLDTLNYKLKSISSYKTEELMDLCNKLGIKTKHDTSNKKITKKDLYEAIILHF